jgi:lysophospholipase L1-like esterase
MALAGFMTAGTLPAAAAPGTVQYVALGDSYAAGVGAGRSLNSCLQSTKGYPKLLDDEGRIGPVDNAACFGATTSEVADDQLSALDRDTRLVTLTVGGNDLNFLPVLIKCTEDEVACPGAVKAALDLFLPGLDSRLKSLYTAIAADAPEARIVVTGYPILFEPGDPDHPSDFSPELVINPVNEATAVLNETIEDAVAATNDADVNIHYVDVTEEFAGHGVLKRVNNPAHPSDRAAFIHSPFICDDETLRDCQDRAAYHPNDEGYSAYADAISAALPGGWLNKQD